MANKHFKPVIGEIPGTAVTKPDELYQAYNEGCFRYQFEHGQGKRSRIMRCSSVSELLWLTEQVASGASVFISEPVSV